jgi:2-iminobutanoate/2-iminopropanoate deaminase
MARSIESWTIVAPGREDAMNRKYNPSTIAPPGGRYTHAIEVPPGARWLHLSGQVGVAPDGSTPEGIAAQTENCFRNIMAILADAGMSLADVVKISVFLIRDADIAGFRAARDRLIGEALPASTLLVVSRLARPEWLIEIEAIAAKV